MEDSSKKVLIIGLGAVLAAGLAALGVYAFRMTSASKTQTPIQIEQPFKTGSGSEKEPEQNVARPVTLTPEQREIVAKVENHEVIITDGVFTPEVVKVKPHDQVLWKNQASSTYQVKGDGWGNVPLEPGETFVQAFKNAGVFTYSCALHPEVTGTVIVE